MNILLPLFKKALEKQRLKDAVRFSKRAIKPGEVVVVSLPVLSSEELTAASEEILPALEKVYKERCGLLLTNEREKIIAVVKE